MKYVFVLSAHVFKVTASPIILYSIRSEGVRNHVSFSLIYQSLMFNLVLSGLWTLAQLVAFFMPSVYIHYEEFWTGSTLIIIMLSVYYHDIVWAIVAWIRYVKVVRKDIWETVDMDLWRRRTTVSSWATLAFITLSLTVLSVVQTIFNGPGEVSNDDIKEPISMALLPMLFVFYGVLPWVITLVPYLLILRHLQRLPRIEIESAQSVDSDGPNFVIFNPQLHGVECPAVQLATTQFTQKF